MSLWKRIAVGFVIMGALVVASSISGGTGIFLIARQLKVLSGAAWQTSGGAKQGALCLESQMRLVSGVVHGVASEDILKELPALRKSAKTAFEDVARGGLLPEETIRKLSDRLTACDAVCDQLLTAVDRVNLAEAQFQKQSDLLLSVSEEMERTGDQEVEGIEKDPDVPFTWNSGLKTRWEAADGGMETSIGFLTQLYHLEKLLAGGNPEECRRRIAEARQFQGDAVTMMLGTGIFKRPFESPELRARFGDSTMHDVCVKTQTETIRCMDDFIAAHIAMNRLHHQYQQISVEVVRTASQINQKADAEVETIREDAVRATIGASLVILVTGLLSIPVAVWAVRLLHNSVAIPIGMAANALQEATGTAATAVIQMTHSISSIAKNTEQAAEVSRSASTVAGKGRESVSSLGQAAQQIHGVVELIDSVAAKTNLLALNATIEAARAGAAGKGFAVVAHEVKSLARQTSDATREIRSRLDEMRSASEKTVADISQIFQVIQEVDSVNQEIARSAVEQKQATGDISLCVRNTSEAADAVRLIVQGTVAFA
ncbi:MAG: methyl-accepting chemotaxis protein [Planctomyces sp.]